MKTMMVAAAIPTRRLGPFPRKHAYILPQVQEVRTQQGRGRCLTSPAPALRTALIKDMMAVFRFTSSRYRPKLRSSSFSSVWIKRQGRKGAGTQDPIGPAFAPVFLPFQLPTMPHPISLPNLSNLSGTFPKAHLFQEASFASPHLSLCPAFLPLHSTFRAGFTLLGSAEILLQHFIGLYSLYIFAAQLLDSRVTAFYLFCIFCEGSGATFCKSRCLKMFDDRIHE